MARIEIVKSGNAEEQAQDDVDASAFCDTDDLQAIGPRVSLST